MAITISGENNNDKILASDGVIDQLSGFSVVGVMTATSFTGDLTGDVTGNLTGNVTGNINNSTLLLQTGGSERIRLTSNNEIGIAGANYGSPGQVLTSGGSGSAVSWATPAVTGFTNGSNNRVVTSTGSAGLNGEANLTFNGSILNLTGDQAISTGNRIYFGNSDVAWVKGVHGASGYLELGVNTAHVTINRSGHIGIGTDNPTLSLQGAWNKVLAISAGTSNGSMIRFIESSSAAGGSNSGLLVGQHNNNSYIVNYQSGFMSLRTNNAERMVITSAGDIGIGINSPTVKLDVAGSLRLQSGGATRTLHMGSHSAGIEYNVNGTTFIQGRTDAYPLVFRTNSTERLRIASDGKVTLGTSTPSSNSAAYMFTVADPTNSLGNCGITIRAGTGVSGGTHQGSIFYSNATSGSGEYAGYLQYNHNDNWFRIGTNSNERLRIDSSGRSLFSGTLGYANIPLGGNPANAAIQIRCTSKYNGIAFGEGAVSGAIGLGGADSSTAMVFTANAHPANLGGGTKDIFEWWSGNSGGGGPGKYMTLDTGGHLALTTGNLEFANGSGIDFSAVPDGSRSISTDGNKLDDYEEGEFTPYIRTNNNSTEPSYHHRVGLYTKVGRLVTWVVRITTSGELSTGSGATEIWGLPFPGVNWNVGDWPGGADLVYYNNLRGSYGTHPRLLGPYNNASYVRFHIFDNQDDTGYNQYNHIFTNNTIIIANGQYFTST